MNIFKHAKKSISLVIVFSLLMQTFVGVMPASAAEIDRKTVSATLNGKSSVVVAPDSQITAMVTGDISNKYDWKGTNYLISTSTPAQKDMKCFSHNTVVSGPVIYERTLSLKAPSTPGVYNVYFMVHGNVNCNGNHEGTMLSISGAITVSNLITNSATLNGQTSVSVGPNETINAAVTGIVGAGSQWRGTKYHISKTEPQPVEMTCVNTSDKNSGTDIDSFNITAPLDYGTYNVYFRIDSSDSCGNDDGTLFILTDAITVVDKIAPQITLNGNSIVTLEYGDTYEELGATWKDNVDPVSGDVVDIAGYVNTKTLGTYVVTYDATDSAGNKAEQVKRTVNVFKRKITVTADSKSKVAGSTDPSLTYSVTGSLVAGDAFTGSLVRADGESAGLYGIGIGSLKLSDNYDLVFVDGILEITPAPVSASIVVLGQTPTNNFGTGFTDFDDTEVLGTQTDKKDADKEDVKGTTDEKKSDSSNILESKIFGIYTWLWLVFLATLAGAGWWTIAGRKK